MVMIMMIMVSVLPRFPGEHKRRASLRSAHLPPCPDQTTPSARELHPEHPEAARSLLVAEKSSRGEDPHASFIAHEHKSKASGSP